MTPHECPNGNRIRIMDGRAAGDGVEVWIGDPEIDPKAGWVIIDLADIQAALCAAGISPVWQAPGDHARHGRRKPYTEAGIVRLPCFRCGNPARFQWSICADGNVQRPLCGPCDADLNTHVLQWAGDPDADQKAARYFLRIFPNHEPTPTDD